MKKILLFAGFGLLQLLSLVVFIGSCIITLSDGQGALIFIFSIPILFLLQAVAFLISKKLMAMETHTKRLVLVPIVFSILVLMFIVTSFIPYLQKIPHTFLEFVGTSFTTITSKTPYTYFKERSSFENKLTSELANPELQSIQFSELDVTFAWDTLCLFGPYTNNQKARSILKLDWNIEERSQIHASDSINALVFLYQGKVNKVIDLKRSIADFQNLETCLDRTQTKFEISTDLNGRKILRELKN